MSRLNSGRSPSPVQVQRGMSMLGTLVIIVLVASGLLLAIKLIPLYIDDYAIGKALQAVAQEEGIVNASRQQIRSSMSRRLSADYTRNLSEDEMVITKQRDKLLIDVVYEARVSLVYNLDLVAKFEHHVEATQ